MYLYIFFILLLIYLLFVAFIKIKFSFWSSQPVFHFYDLLYWLKPPGIINKDIPKYNKFFNTIDIITKGYHDYDSNSIIIICDFIKKYYSNKSDIKYIPNKNNIVEYLKSCNNKSFITLYTNNKTIITNQNINFDDIVGVITCKSINITLKNKKSFSTYYTDNLCVHPGYRNKGIAPKLIQTHYFNIRKYNENINTCLFKREGNMTAIIPLVTYHTYTYNINDLSKIKNNYNENFVIEINSKNIHLFTNFIFNNTKSFDCVIVPDISNIINLINTNNISIYGNIINNHLSCVYIFRDASLEYKSSSSIECIATLYNKDILDISTFFEYFFISLNKCNKKYTSKYLLFENTADTYNIIDYISKHNIKQLYNNPTAFFLYNYACYTCNPKHTFLLY